MTWSPSLRAAGVVTGDVVISGNPLKLAELFSLFDEFPSNFEVVEPRKATIE